MVDYNQAEILKKVSFFVDAQFPALYKEFGPELIQLVRDYYEFMETDTDQSVYNIRRIFEYRDISTTISSMIIHFQRMFMADLPYKEDQIVFVIKNIMDLYRAKGTEQGIELFFRLFYNEDIEVYYPAQKMFKPSSSNWRTGNFLQMFPTTNEFISKTGVKYTYLDLLGRNITGSTSGAKSSVNKINFILLNGIITPIIYIDNLQGNYIKYDDVLTQISGETVSFGKINGSLVDLDIDDSWSLATTGNKLGDIFDVQGTFGVGGRAIVTEVSDEITGTIVYEYIDGGFGYTVENSRLLVSDQVVILDAGSRDTEWDLGETIGDRFGNEGVLTGFSEIAIGVKMNAGQDFDETQSPQLRRRDFANSDIFWTDITNKNSSSPGPLYPDGTPPDANTQVTAVINNIENISLITDPIAPFLAVTLNSSNYNDVPPAGQPMSGSANPVTIATPLNQAFDLTPFNIGSIDIFKNVDPGVNYTNDVFAFPEDSQMVQFDRKDQIIQLSTPAAAGSFNVGETITEANTGVVGKVRGSNTQIGSITVTPYAYYGFSGQNNIVRDNTDVFTILGVETDYNSQAFGENAIVQTEVEFATGKIKTARIFNSGLGYSTGETGYLANNNILYAKGTITADSQGVTEGYWADFNSHLNGYRVDTANNYNYFDSSMKVQDSDYFQEYSYEVRSMLGKTVYEDFLRDTMHTAGTKMFGKFAYNRKFETGPTDQGVKQRFIRIFNDDGESTSPLDIGNTANLTSDFTNIFVDTELVTSDNDSSFAGGGTISYQLEVQGGATSVDEGSALTFIVTTTNFPNGPLYWSIPNTGDFQFQSGNVNMTNNSGTFQLTPLADGVTEGAETFTVTLHTGSGAGPVVTSVGPITINDTSTGTFTPDYTINVTTPIFDYVFNGSHGGGTLSSATNPTLTFSVGDKVQFNIDSSTQTSHPFYLKTVQGSGTGNQISGVTGQGGATLQWVVGSTGTFYYQCAVHGSMNNTITVT